MNRDQEAWQRLAAAARLAPRNGDEAAPFGFSTRVAALAMAAESSGQSIFARRLWIRASGIAFLFALAAVAANYSAIMAAFDDEPAVVVADDPVAEVVGLGS